MTKPIDMTGHVIEGITVLANAGSKNGKIQWTCLCKCGCEFEASGTGLRLGRVRGCRSCVTNSLRVAATKHNAIGTPEYRSYNALKARCYNLKNKRYGRYGGRGITVCDRWLESFSNFLLDMGLKPSPAYSIERIDREKGYEPGNCIWADRFEQANNRSNNTLIEINGCTQNIGQWAHQSGVNRTVILRRLKRGISGEKLIYKGVLK